MAERSRPEQERRLIAALACPRRSSRLPRRNCLQMMVAPLLQWLSVPAVCGGPAARQGAPAPEGAPRPSLPPHWQLSRKPIAGHPPVPASGVCCFLLDVPPLPPHAPQKDTCLILRPRQTRSLPRQTKETVFGPLDGSRQTQCEAPAPAQQRRQVWGDVPPSLSERQRRRTENAFLPKFLSGNGCPSGTLLFTEQL